MFLLNSDIFLWDFAILLLLCLSGGFAIGTGVLAKRKHSKALTFLCTLCTLCTLLVFYSAFIEPQIITITEKSISHKMAPKLNIAIMSDAHIGPYKGKAFITRAVRRINAKLPDIVLLPGDFVYTHHADLDALDPLQNISAPLGVYAVLGNHDVGLFTDMLGNRYSSTGRGEDIAEKLTSLGVTVLRNEHVVKKTPNGSIAISGIDDMWTGNASLTAAMEGIPNNAYSILLSHNPSIIDSPLSHKAHLIVAGHTHGGQLRLPFIGPLAHLPTTLGQGFDQGIFAIDEDTTLAITRGIGESSARMRLFAWPEILLLELRAES